MSILNNKYVISNIIPEIDSISPHCRNRIGIDTISIVVNTPCPYIDKKTPGINWSDNQSKKWYGNRWSARFYRGYLVILINSPSPKKPMSSKIVRQRIINILTTLSIPQSDWDKIHINRLDITLDSPQKYNIDPLINPYSPRRRLEYKPYYTHTSTTHYYQSKSETICFYPKHIELKERYNLNIQPLYRREWRLLKTTKLRRLALSKLATVLHLVKRLAKYLKDTFTHSLNIPTLKLIDIFISLYLILRLFRQPETTATHHFLVSSRVYCTQF